MTKFSTCRMEAAGLHFFFDGNGKIALDNGSFDDPKPNAFSLVQHEDCPQSTETCRRDCYVNRLEDNVPDVHLLYRMNSASIRLALLVPQVREEVVGAFASWITENAPHGFRWHVSGDIFSEGYAKFVRDVCLRAGSVRFWTYTRSFRFLEHVADVQNLVVNLSADVDNFHEAVDAAMKFKKRICYMTVTGWIPPLPPESVVFPSHQLRGRDLPDPTEAPWWKSLSNYSKKLVCPPDFFGQSEKLRCGPCSKCLF